MAKLSLKLVAIGLLAITELSGSQFALAQDTAGAEQPSAPSASKVEAKPVSFIRVEGTLRVEAETVRAYMVLREGMRAEAQLIDQSVKTLFASGLFADVNIRREGDGLIVSVIENPIINRVSFEGNIKINSDTLQGESSLRPRLVYTRSKVQDDVERFLELYRRAGRFSAVIEPKVIQLPQNRVDLVFEIVEGPLTGIRSINFIGNEAYDDGRLMEEIATSESHWWKFLSSSDNYDPDRIAYDRELLRQFYLGRGYADFRVISSTAELTRDGDAFFVTFNLEEGPIYNFDKSEIKTSLEKLTGLNLETYIKHEEGERYDARKIDKTVDALTKIVGEQGFAFADIRPRVKRDPETQKVSITYSIEEGPRVYVERINVNGNTRTQDNVIRREMKLSEGDGFNRVLLSRSERDIRGLNFFEKVDIVEQPGTEPDQVILDVDVQEKSTGELAIGVGFSSTDSFSTQFSISERNFLGRGQTLQLSANASSETSRFIIGFTEPYFLGRDLSAGFRVFNSVYDYDYTNYETTEFGGTFSLGFPVSDDARLSLYASLREVSQKYNNGYEADESRHSFGYYFAIDKRDDYIDPTQGWNFGFGQDLALPTGDITFLRTTADADYYYNLAEGYVVHSGLTAGYIDGYEGESVRSTDRFYKGASSFRGFDRSGVGPRRLLKDSAGVIKDDYAVGSNAYIIGTFELSLPLMPKELGMKTKAFIDYGAVGTTDEDPYERAYYSSWELQDDFAFRSTFGLSVSWNSPIGPIQFDFARPIASEDYDRERFFRFTAGTKF